VVAKVVLELVVKVALELAERVAQALVGKVVLELDEVALVLAVKAVPALVLGVHSYSHQLNCTLS
jgi:hypothetical protein